jgi:multisubunit Na+/H+ antiporter MnhE subunit
LKFIRDNNLEEYKEVIEQYFTTDVHSNIAEALNQGANTVELMPGGSSIRVTDQNKDLFIRKKCFYIAYQCV